MTRPQLELADILRLHGSEYRQSHPVSSEQSQVMQRLVQCRTAALGGHVEQCRFCPYVRIAYNSCRNRHCPKCQTLQRAAWLEKRLARLLPVPYIHVVFTLPDGLHPLVLKNPRALYTLLFQAASATLLTLARDPQRLGAQVGFTMILHTWGQNLLLHPHVHAVVTGGGLSADGLRWMAGRARYFLPVKVMGRLFRGKFLAGLQQLYRQGKLLLHGSIAGLALSAQFRLHQGQVTFGYKDYADGHKRKQITLQADEFIRRFLLHVLPKGFVRIRHYGLLASCQVTACLAQCRSLLTSKATASYPFHDPRFKESPSGWDAIPRSAHTAIYLCYASPSSLEPLLDFLSPSLTHPFLLTLPSQHVSPSSL